MKLLINQKEFAKAIKIVKDVCDKRSLQPILATLMIETVDGGIKVYGTNLNESIVTSVEAKVEQQGKVCVNADKLNEIVNRVDNPIELETNGGYLHVKAGKAKFKIMTVNENEYPNVKFMNEGDIIVFNAKEFKQSVKNVLISVAYENTNVLSGVDLKIEDNKLKLASTDGNRLSVDEIECSGNNREIVCPKNLLINLIKNDFENLEMVCGDNDITFIADNTIYKANLINGQFPKYEAIIPQNNNKIATIKTSDLLKAIDRVAIMINDKTNILKLVFDKNSLILRGDNVEVGDAEDEIEINYEGEPINIGFNYTYLLDFLRNCQQDTITVKLNQPASATLFIDTYTYLVMPIQIRN